jgi:hypothetical protein
VEQFVHSLKVFWRAERLLTKSELRLNIQKVQLSAMAGLAAFFGLMMLGIAAFFALVPYMGQALAALTVAGIDLVAALLLIVLARSLKPPAEVAMVQEFRDMALSEIEHEIALADAELVALKDDVRRLVRNPVGTLLPEIIGPLISGVAEGLKSRKTKESNEAD